ncbi:hypothetical protein ACFFHJ_32680 [Planotetraspora thailandica]|uniref:hypothetical protein n=1 Tax=Planotetraspora thailandica TaxID=487172 RepID=UPI0019519B43|nr:hypothetical protein [Planotetraspora thailandica]
MAIWRYASSCGLITLSRRGLLVRVVGLELFSGGGDEDDEELGWLCPEDRRTACGHEEGGGPGDR